MGKEGFYEENIRYLILQKERIFGDIGDSTIVFEKAIMRGHTICDCLVFTEKQGLIGIEIKTERDSTQRLNKQLNDYERVCDFVYVICHDDHVAKVEQILTRHKHRHVGILAYTEFRGEPILGIYKEAQRSPNKSAYHMFDILWKEEILKMLGTFRHFGKKIESATGDIVWENKNREGLGGLYVQPLFSRKMRKSVLITNLISKLGGEQEATKVFCDIFIHHKQHPEKAIKYYHFIDREKRLDE